MGWVDWILAALAAIVSIPIALLACETLLAALPRRIRMVDPVLPRPRFAVLVPAHNEAAGIGAAIEAIRRQLGERDRLIVIADNCTDDTASAARFAGAEAIERLDPDRRGKGFALDFGLKHLDADPPEVVVLIDADTLAHPHSIQLLVSEAQTRQTAIQGVFTDNWQAPHGRLSRSERAPFRGAKGDTEAPFRGAKGDHGVRGPREQWSAFALTFKNLVRPLGLHRLGLPCLLTGSGMAFPYSVIRGANLGTGNIVEDMKLGIDLAVAGHAARFCPDARFESDDAPNLEAATTRRTRWEHGHVFTLLTQVPRLMAAGLRSFRPKLWALALELAVPPLSLLFLVQGLLLTGCLAWWLAGGGAVPATVLLSAAATGVGTILAAWAIFGRQLISAKILCLLPIYVLWKVPIYLKLLFAPQRNWVRTERKPIG